MAEPIIKIKHKTLDIAVFTTEWEGKTFYDAVCSRSKFDKTTNTWKKQTITLDEDQLLLFAGMLEKTFWLINEAKDAQPKPTKVESIDNEIPF